MWFATLQTKFSAESLWGTGHDGEATDSYVIIIMTVPNLLKYFYAVTCRKLPNERVVKTIYKWKLYATRPKGRPRLRWEDDAKNDLKKMGVNNWKQRVQERKQWKDIIQQAKTHKEL